MVNELRLRTMYDICLKTVMAPFNDYMNIIMF